LSITIDHPLLDLKRADPHEAEVLAPARGMQEGKKKHDLDFGWRNGWEIEKYKSEVFPRRRGWVA